MLLLPLSSSASYYPCPFPCWSKSWLTFSLVLLTYISVCLVLSFPFFADIMCWAKYFLVLLAYISVCLFIFPLGRNHDVNVFFFFTYTVVCLFVSVSLMVVVLTFLFSCLHYLHIRLLFCLFPFSSKLWLRYFFLSYLYFRLSLLILVLFLVGRNCCLLVFLSFLPVSSSFSFSFPCWSKLSFFVLYLRLSLRIPCFHVLLTYLFTIVYSIFVDGLHFFSLPIPSSVYSPLFHLRRNYDLHFFLSLLIPSSVYILLFHLRRNYGLDIFLPLLPTSPSVSSPCPLPSSLKSLPT